MPGTFPTRYSYLLYSYQDPNTGNFCNTCDLGGQGYGTPAAALNNADLLHVVVVGTNFHVFAKWRPNSLVLNGFTANWTDMGAPPGGASSSVSAIRDGSGKIELFVRGGGSANAMYTKYQTSPGGGWSSWVSLGGVSISKPLAQSYNTYGARLYVYGTDGNRYVNVRVSAGCCWSGWQRG